MCFEIGMKSSICSIGVCCVFSKIQIVRFRNKSVPLQSGDYWLGVGHDFPIRRHSNLLVEH